MKKLILSIISAVFLSTTSGVVFADPTVSSPITPPGCTQVCTPIPCEPGKMCSRLVICKIVCPTDAGGSEKGSPSSHDGSASAN